MSVRSFFYLLYTLKNFITNKSQFENALQTSTNFQIAFLKYFGEISFIYPSGKLWNFFKNTEFIISHIVRSQPIPQAEMFYIDGTKNAKASFWFLKKYEVFYTKFHSAQQNESYALIQVICLHRHPINIVSDFIYCFCIKKYRNLHHKLLVLLNQTMQWPCLYF